jgi:hypothetical protein
MSPIGDSRRGDRCFEFSPGGALRMKMRTNHVQEKLNKNEETGR